VVKMWKKDMVAFVKVYPRITRRDWGQPRTLSG